MDLKEIKLEYVRDELNLDDLNKNPYIQLKNWLDQAIKLEVSYPNAVSISTVNKENIPSTRIVLIKNVSDNGLVFFTDYDSQKGLDIESNNNVSILFFWKELDRQIRLTGKAYKTSRADSEEYFNSRARESQINAYASNQSKTTTKKLLYTSVENITKKFKNKEIECPTNWGGYNVTIEAIEFWQGRPNRLHDRFKYSKSKSGWDIKRLCP